jgi:signal transduction histidine kinase
VELSRHSQAAVDGAIAGAALTAERAIAGARIIFEGALLARFFLATDDLSVGRVALTACPLAAGFVFSLWVLARVRTPPRTGTLWLASVLLDAFTVGLVLLPNVLWPVPLHRGILALPDSSGILVGTVAAGLRLSPPAALAGALVNMAWLVALVAADRLVSGPRGSSLGAASVYAVLVGGMGLLAVILAVTTRRLARRSALAGWRAELAEQGLGTVLADSHDLSSLLTATTLGAERVVAGLRSGGATQRLDATAEQMLANLRQVRSVAIEVRNRAMGDLTALHERVAVELSDVIAWALDQLRRLHPETRLGLASPVAPGLRVLLAGGEPTLQRILLNVLANACESQGREVVVRVVAEPEGRVAIHVEDDGPGVPAAVRDGQAQSTKPGGSGVGLSVVRGLTEASGGLFRLQSRPQRGTDAVLTLLREV